MLRRFVACLQALFAVGCTLLIVKLLRGGGTAGPILFLAGGLALLGALGIWAAILMWRDKPGGAVLTLALQVVHLLYLETASLTIAVSIPLAVVVGLGPSLQPHWWFAWKPSIEITFESLDQSPWVGVNLVALLSTAVAARMLVRLLRESQLTGTR